MNYLNFNNAGSSRTFPSSNKAIIKYLKLEEKYGGYYCAKRFSNIINKLYLNLSKLINCKQSEISFISNTTFGFNLFINSFVKIKNGNIVIFDNEYESNIICLQKNKINFKIVKTNKEGDFDINELKSKIDHETLVVNLCHISTNNGNENLARKVGNIVKSINPNIIYSIDACQSIGHISVDVKELKCDVLIGSGRKFLRGPRGTGFIYLKETILDLIEPFILDSHNSKKTFKKDHIFENFEYSPALKIGLSKSIENINRIGISKIEKNIKLKSIYFREKLKKNTNIHFYEDLSKISGLNTFSVKNYSAKKVHDFLLRNKILTSVVEKKNYFINKKNKISNALRVSFHYYNTYKQIDYLIKCISKI